MNHADGMNSGEFASPEQLSAYVDGEMSPVERLALEAWLADHPERLADISTWRRLADEMRATRPIAPSSQVWGAIESRVAVAMAAPRKPARRVRRLAIGVAIAATVLILVLAKGSLRRPAAEEEFPVAEAHEVVILSMDPGDAGALVVGHAPHLDAIVLASHEEVSLVSVEPFPADGATPDMWVAAGAGPMIVPGASDDR